MEMFFFYGKPFLFLQNGSFYQDKKAHALKQDVIQYCLNIIKTTKATFNLYIPLKYNMQTQRNTLRMTPDKESERQHV